MPAPTVGEIRSFYCDCLATTRNESYRDKDQKTEERSIVERSPLSTSWISKRRSFKEIGFGIFSVGTLGWMYYWECMNCGKIRDIGVWGEDGSEHGDGRHL